MTETNPSQLNLKKKKDTGRKVGIFWKDIRIPIQNLRARETERDNKESAK